MNFTSDNVTGASPPIMEAMLAANSGSLPAYGNDSYTRDAERRIAELFEHDVTVALVATGTGANALSLGLMAPPGTAVFCHDEAHVIDDECGAPEFYTGGAKLVGVPGLNGKVDVAGFEDVLTRFPRGVVRQVPPAALSLSQATEAGTIYTCDEIATLSQTAHAAGLKVHMDGARFANALVRLGATPAEMTWQAGIDVLSFGASKNGALACEAVIVFDPACSQDLQFRRKRGGHTLSKGRFLGAQMIAYLGNDHWLANARSANRTAARLRAGLEAMPGVRCPWPQDANEVFAVLPMSLDASVRADGFQYHAWSTRAVRTTDRPGDEEVMVRLICSFQTADDDVDRLLGSFMRNSERHAEKVGRIS